MNLTNDELLAELDRRRAALAGPMATGPGAGALTPPFNGTAGMAPPMMGPPMQPAAGGVRAVGLLVSITIPTPAGEVPCYLQLGPEAAANPQLAVQQLMQAGWPVKCWQPRQQNGWGGGGQGGFQGGGMRRGWGRY